MLKKLNFRYLFMALSSLIVLNAMSMQKENTPKALTEIVCKSINNYISKSSDPDEAVKWITSKSLPEEVKEIVKRYAIKFNNHLLRRNFTGFVPLMPKKFSKNIIYDKDKDIVIVCDKNSISMMNFTSNKYTEIPYTPNKSQGKFRNLLFTVSQNNTLYINDTEKMVCIGAVSNSDTSVILVSAIEKNKCLMIPFNGESIILCLDSQTGKYREATLEEIVYLIVSGNVLRKKYTQKIKCQVNNEVFHPTCLVS